MKLRPYEEARESFSGKHECLAIVTIERSNGSKNVQSDKFSLLNLILFNIIYYLYKILFNILSISKEILGKQKNSKRNCVLNKLESGQNTSIVK